MNFKGLRSVLNKKPSYKKAYSGILDSELKWISKAVKKITDSKIGDASELLSLKAILTRKKIRDARIKYLSIVK